jgi:hypothetical protein
MRPRVCARVCVCMHARARALRLIAYVQRKNDVVLHLNENFNACRRFLMGGVPHYIYVCVFVCVPVAVCVWLCVWLCACACVRLAIRLCFVYSRDNNLDILFE